VRGCSGDEDWTDALRPAGVSSVKKIFATISPMRQGKISVMLCDRWDWIEGVRVSLN
jgi:hypothetical protein